MIIEQGTLQKGEIVLMDDSDAANFNALYTKFGMALLKRADGSYEYYNEFETQ